MPSRACFQLTHLAASRPCVHCALSRTFKLPHLIRKEYHTSIIAAERSASCIGMCSGRMTFIRSRLRRAHGDAHRPNGLIKHQARAGGLSCGCAVSRQEIAWLSSAETSYKVVLRLVQYMYLYLYSKFLHQTHTLQPLTFASGIVKMIAIAMAEPVHIVAFTSAGW